MKGYRNIDIICPHATPKASGHCFNTEPCCWYCQYFEECVKQWGITDKRHCKVLGGERWCSRCWREWKKLSDNLEIKEKVVFT